MIYISIPGEVPSKKNSRINTRNGKSFPSKAYDTWHDVAMFHTITQAKGKKAPEPCSIACVFFHKDLRRRDCDNGLSSVLDMLVDAGIIQDDDWKHVKTLSATASLDKDNPRCVICILEPGERLLEAE